MEGLSYGKKDGKELQTYHYSPAFAINELHFVSNGTGDRSQATLINCSNLSAGRTKSIRVQAYDSGQASVVLSFWFAETKEQLEELVANGEAANLLVMQGSLDITLPVSSAWFAIDYDAALTGTTIEGGNFYVSLIIT